MNCSLPGSSVHGISQAARILSCHFLLQGIFPTQGLTPCLQHCRLLYCWATQEAVKDYTSVKYCFHLLDWINTCSFFRDTYLAIWWTWVIFATGPTSDLSRIDSWKCISVALLPLVCLIPNECDWCISCKNALYTKHFMNPLILPSIQVKKPMYIYVYVCVSHSAVSNSLQPHGL